MSILGENIKTTRLCVQRDGQNKREQVKQEKVCGGDQRDRKSAAGARYAKLEACVCVIMNVLYL